MAAKPWLSFTTEPSLKEWSVPAQTYLKRHPHPDGKNLDNIATSALIFRTSTDNDSNASNSPQPQRRVLLLQRAAHDSMPLCWEPPGGAVDPGETILEGCAREVYEESGLAARRIVRVVKDGIVFRNSSGTMTIGKVVFEVEGNLAGEGESESEDTAGVVVKLDPNEHADWAWVTEDEVRKGMVKGREEKLAGATTYEVLMEGFRLKREEDARV
jgi:8-oxo-dGTP pyrophosphatase MutT (NUDIX family)